MDAKEAVQAAKQHIIDIFSDEEIIHIGLEEITLDDRTDEWVVTIGFERPWGKSGILHQTILESVKRRTYKVVRIQNPGGEVTSLTDRILPTQA